MLFLKSLNRKPFLSLSDSRRPDVVKSRFGDGCQLGEHGYHGSGQVACCLYGGMVDGVVLVVDAGKARGNELRRWVGDMRRVKMQIPFIGVVLNRATNHRRAYYYYYTRKNDQAEESGSLSLSRSQKFNWFNRQNKKQSSNDDLTNSDISKETQISADEAEAITTSDVHGTLEEAYQISPPNEQSEIDDLNIYSTEQSTYNEIMD